MPLNRQANTSSLRPAFAILCISMIVAGCNGTAQTRTTPLTFMEQCLASAKNQSDINECHWRNIQRTASHR